jgi:hypothetical protein
VSKWSDLIEYWGSTPSERQRRFPCDALVPAPDLVLWRAVDVAAPSSLVFRWLCQLRQAPYSYDWLDNLGRRSPRHLTPGLDELRIGQRFMTLFHLAACQPGRSITVVTDLRVFGQFAATYDVTPTAPGACRLVVKLVVTHRGGVIGRVTSLVLPAGDLLMMRRQLLNLKRLAERSMTDAGSSKTS